MILAAHAGLQYSYHALVAPRHSGCCQLSHISAKVETEMMGVVEQCVVTAFNLVPLTLEEQRSLKKLVQALMGTSSRSKKFLDRSPTLKTDQRTMGARSCSYPLAAPLVVWHLHCLLFPVSYYSLPSHPIPIASGLCSSCVIHLQSKSGIGPLLASTKLLLST